MHSNTSHLLRGLAVFMAFLAGMFMVLAVGGARMALAHPSGSPGSPAIYAPLHDGTPEATETEHGHDPDETETHEPDRTRTPESTRTHEVEPTETDHDPEATETHEPHGTRTAEPSRTREVEPTETEHDPEATETHEPHGTRTPEGTETAEATRTHEVEPTETHEVEPTETHRVEPTMTVTPGSAPGGVSGSSTRYFPQTGKSVSGAFLQYWDRNGGVMQQGYPLSSAGAEVSSLNGKPYTVQYFERSVFESHPENQAPYNVLLSQLGTFRYQQKYPNGAPNQVANRTNAHYFPETKHWVGGVFWTYWQQNGGLMQQGYPLSDQFQEKSDLDGKTYTVQYFERAVFEFHPENKAPYNVLLSQLGRYQYDQRYGSK